MPEELPSSTRRPGETRAAAEPRRAALPPGGVLPADRPGHRAARRRPARHPLEGARLAARRSPRWPPASGCSCKAWQGGLLRSALNVAVQPELLQWVGVGIMVGAVLWVGSIVLTAEQSWPRRRRAGRWGRVLFAAAACTPRRRTGRRWPCATSTCSRRSSTRCSSPTRQRAPRRRPRRHRRRGPVGRRAAGQHPAHRLRRRQGPLGHPHRLDDGRQHQHQDR